MALAPGTRLGPYEILSTLGAGGMGEVYRARDTKLGREVALKILLEAFAQDAERMARFEREAKVLASLNHPNIATIHGLEESNGLRALVMELVEGQTLAEMISGVGAGLKPAPTGARAIPIDEALSIAKQIAEGLEYAHERGIIHRDLKPANIKITPDGVVKLLDFGLAKALDDEAAPTDASHSPTLTVAATRAGVILGTAAYMSPEQARGHAADRRSDIWSFGVVLYQMLTGKPCFTGETVSDTLAAVLRAEIPLDALPAETPPPIRKLLRRCLERDRKRRLRDIGEARIAIEEYLANPADASVLMSAVVAPARPLWHRVLPWAVAGLMTLAFALVLFALLREPAPPAPSVVSLEFDTGKLSLAAGYGSRIAISPDGRKMVFVATASGSQTQQLYLRSMDIESITPLSGTQGAQQPFFSPDGQWVGFSANGKLEKVPLGGGLPMTLCDVPGKIPSVAATWADNGSIYFINLDQGKLYRVPEGGGSPQPVPGADPDKLPYFWISSLPGSRGLLLTAVKSAFSEFDIDVLSLETGKSKRLIENGSWPRYLPTGQILYAQYSSAEGSSGFTGGLLAVPFDLKSLAVTGSPIPVIDGVATGSIGGVFYDVSTDGTLVYYPSSRGATANTRLDWLDAKGKIEPLPAPPGNYSYLSISPDGKRVALTKTTGSSSDIYIYDLTRNTMQRLTFNGRSNFPIFTPDGSRVIYSSTGGSGQVLNLWMRPADGSGKAERLTTSQFFQFRGTVSPDGKLLAYSQYNPKTNLDIYVMPLEGNRKPQVFLQSPSSEHGPTYSPDGKWIAYESNESGKYQIYVQAFPGPGGKYQISTGAGPNVGPLWSRDGKKLYYNSGNNLMEVNVSTHPTFSAGTPRLVAANLGIQQAARNYAVAPDGRILLTQPVQQAQQSQQGSPQLHVILHFATEVRNRLGAAKQ